MVEPISFVDAVRRRASMYLGDDRSLWFVTLLDCLLECPVGQGEIVVGLERDGHVWVEDDGVGISSAPYRHLPSDVERPFLESMVFSMLVQPDSPRSIGFARDSQGRASCGLCFINVFSLWLDIRACHAGQASYMRTEDGALAVPVTLEGDCSRSGNVIAFMPHGDFISQDDLGGPALFRLLREVAAREKCIVRLVDNRHDGRTESFESDS